MADGLRSPRSIFRYREVTIVELKIRFIFEDIDRKRFMLYSFFGRRLSSAAAMIIVPLFFILLPTVWFLSMLISGNVSLLLFMYLFAAWLFVFSLVNKMNEGIIKTPQMYTFSAEGLDITINVCKRNIPVERLSRIEDSRYFYTLFTDSGVAYPIPKRFMTPDENARLKAFLPNIEKVGKTDEGAFEGIRCEEPVFCEMKDEYTETLTAGEDFIKSAVNIHTVQDIPKMLFLFFVMFLILSGISPAVGAVVGAVYVLYLMIFSRKNTASSLKLQLEQLGAFTLHFHDKCFDIERNGIERIYFESIRGVKKSPGLIRIITDRGSFMIPYSDKIMTAVLHDRKDG